MSESDDEPTVQSDPPDSEPEPQLPVLPDELSPRVRARLWAVARAVTLMALGLLAGLYWAPDTPQKTQAQIDALTQALKTKESRIGELEQLARAPLVARGPNKLSTQARAHFEKEGRRYVALLRRTGAQSAANLMTWFVHRWLDLVDFPQEDDRTSRRAAALALLVGGMASNLNPGDYVPWQAEFLSNTWLPEIHRDADGDGLPGPRSRANLHDGFANVSVCHVAMALNLALTDAQILMMPEMRCDRPDSRISVFLQGETFDQALDEFMRAAREHGLIVLERKEKDMRLLLVGPKPQKDEDND